MGGPSIRAYLRRIREDVGLRAAGFVVCAVLIGGIGILAHATLRKSIAANEWVRETQQAMFEIEALGDAIDDVESAQRGYLLSGDQVLLQEYERSAAETGQVLSRIRRAVSDNPAQVERLAALEPLVARWLTVLSQNLRLRSPSGQLDLEAAGRLRGAALTPAIDRATSDMLDAQRQLLLDRIAAAVGQGRVLAGVTLGGSTVSIGIVGIIFLLIGRESRKRRQAETELAAANAALERRVESRTRELRAEIAERERADAALERLRSLQQRVERAAKIGHWSWQSMPDSAAWKDASVEYSASAKEILGVAPDDAGWINSDFVERFIHPDDRKRAIKVFDEAGQRGGYAIEYRILRPDGQIRIVREVAQRHAHQPGEGPLSSGILQDITEMKEAELALKASEERYRQVVELGQELIWIHADGVIVFANGFAARLLDAASPDALVGRPFLSLVHPDDRELSRRRTARALGGQTSLPAVELRLVGLTGRTITLEFAATPFDFQGRPAILAIGRDVTEHRAARAALQESESLARQVLETALNAYVRMDGGGLITEWNAQAEQIFGWPRAEAVGKPLADLIVPAPQREPHRRGLQRFLQTGHGPLVNRRIEVDALHRDGHQFPAEVAITPIKTDGGYIFSAFIANIEDRKSTEQQLRQALKLEAVGQLTAGIAHDFNNQLGIVIGNLDLIAEHAPGDVALTKLAQNATDAALRGADMTKRLLAFSRKQTLAPRVVNFNDMLPGVVPMLRRMLGEQIVVQLKPGEDLWACLIDPAQIEEAILNLAINSRDAMPGGGTLTLATANCALDLAAAGQLGDAAPGDYVLLAVGDTGTGMDPAVAERAFEPFFTTKAQDKGTGLGLSMVYGVVKQSNGHIKIHSEVGRGTTIRLYLPRALPAASSMTREPASRTVQRGEETILVVEDNPGVRGAVIDQLNRLGYSVLQASDARDGLAILQAHPEIGLLFSDVVMPGGMTGYDLVKEARKERPALKVLLTSGYAAASHASAADDLRGVELISKPFRMAELAARIRKVLAEP